MPASAPDSVRPGRGPLWALAAAFAVLIMASTTAEAADLAFGDHVAITHPDKKVSGPAAVIDGSGRIYVGWTREDLDRVNVYITASDDGGKTFSAPARVNTDGDHPAGVHEPPALAVGGRGEVYAAWTASRKGAELAADILFSRSTDGGKTFSRAIRVNTNETPSSRGFESMAAGPGGSIYMAWLDGREKGSSATYVAKSVDGGKTFGKEVKVDGGSCPCCRTATTVSTDGTVFVAWRKVFKGDIREIVVAKSTDGSVFTKPAIVANDNWEIQGCPHRGPSIAVAPDGALHIAWYTEGEEMTPGVYLASSRDGVTFTREALPWARGAFPDHPVTALTADGKAIAAWEETTPVLSKVVVSTGGDKKPEQMNQGVRRAHHPLLYAGPGGEVLVGWAQDEIRNTRFVFRIANPR